MTPPERCYRDQIGAFLLDKLDGGERETVRAHLDGCPYCQAEVGVLEPVVAALADADPDRIEEDARPPGDLEESTLAPVLEEIYRPRSRGRRSPWSTLAAAAVCVLAMGLAGFAWLLEPAVAMVEPLKFSVERDMKVEGYLSEHAWGTEIELVVFSGLREGQTYVVTLVSEDGERVNAGTFIGAGDKPVRGTFNAALAREDAVKLEASTPGGEPVFFAELPEEPRDLVHDWPLLGVLPWEDPDLQIETMGSSSPEGQGEPKDPGSWYGSPPPWVSPPGGDPKGSSPPGGKPGAAPEGGESGGGLDKPPPYSVPPTSPASPAPEPDPCELPPDEQPPTCPQYDPQL
jgi:hypothetical protein